MKKSVLFFSRIYSLLIAGLLLLCLSSCAGLLQRTGSVSFEINKALIQAARDGGYDGPVMQFEVSLEGNGGYGIKQTIFIPMEDYEACMQTDKKFEASFDNIPAGKTYYAYIRVYRAKEAGMTGEPAAEPILIGKSKAFKVKAGENIVDMKAFSYRCEYDFSLEITVPEEWGYTEAEVSELQNDLVFDVILADTSVAKKLIAAGTDKYKLYDVFSKNVLPSVMNFYSMPGSNERITFENDGNALQIEGKIDLPVDENTYGTCGKEVIFIASAKNYEEPAPYLYGKSAKVTPVKGEIFETSIDLRDITFSKVLYYKESDYYSYDINGESYENMAGSFCLDKDGYFYGLGENGDAYQLYSNKPGFSSEVFPVAEVPEEFGYDFMFSPDNPVTTIDKQLNEFYATFDISYEHGYENESLKLYRFCSLLESGEVVEDEVMIYNISSEGWTFIKGQSFVVNNGILYTIAKENQSEKYKLVIIDLRKPIKDGNQYGISASEISSVEINWDSYDFVTNLASDMSIIDNALYILVNDSFMYYTEEPYDFEYYDTQSIFSRGLLIKYNLLTKQVLALGWSNDSMLRGEMNDEGMYIAYGGKIFYQEENTTKPYIIPASGKVSYTMNINGTDTQVEGDAREFFPSLYMPNPLSDTLSDEAFYGPEKIIGILPKKLVIADNGVAVFVDSNNALRYQNVNRTVTINLEKFALEEVENSGCDFSSEISESLTPLGQFDSRTWTLNGYNGTKYQNVSGSTFADMSTVGSLYLTILEKQN